MELGAGWVEVALAGCQAMGRPYVDNTAQTEVRVVADPPDQVCAVESRRGVGGRGIRGRGWWKVGRGKEQGRGKWARVKVIRSERDETTYTR